MSAKFIKLASIKPIIIEASQSSIKSDVVGAKLTLFNVFTSKYLDSETTWRLFSRARSVITSNNFGQAVLIKSI